MSVDYLQVNANAGLVGENFPGSVLPFNFNLREDWHPDKSFLLTRLEFSNGDGSAITLSDVDKAPNMNLCPNLFNNIELLRNGKCISQCSNYVAEIDTFKNRILQSDKWLETGGQLNFWNPKQQERLNQIASDGYLSESTYGVGPSIINLNRVGQGFDAQAAANSNTIEVQADGTIEFTKNVGVDLFDLEDIYLPGDTITYLNVVYTVVRIIGGNVNTQTLIATPIPAAVGADSDVDWFQDRPVGNNVKDESGNESAQRSSIELIWRPTCGAFDLSVLPKGEYVLNLVTNNDPIYQKRSIESVNVDVPADATAAGIKIRVQKMELFVAKSPHGNNTPMKSANMREVLCRKINIDRITITQYKQQFQVDKNTQSIALAFIDRTAGSDTRFTNTKFKIRPITGNPDYESGDQAVSKISLRYNGQSKPMSTPFPRYAKPQDYIAEMYTTTMVYNGVYNGKGLYREGGIESKRTWLERGPYYHFWFSNKKGFNRTELDITFQFDVDLDANSAAGLLFNSYMNNVSLD